MAFDYSRVANIATAQIKNFGRSMTLSQGSSDWDPATSVETSTTATDTTITAVATAFKANQIDGTTILAGDKMFLIAAKGLSVTPSVDDKIVDGADTWHIQSVETVQPGPTAILYKAHARR